MVKLFRNHVLSIFTAAAFFLAQVVNVHANYLRNSPQKEDVVNYISKQMGNPDSKTTDIATLYVPGLSHEVENNSATKGKIEKVLEPITIGTFGLGMAAGYITSMVGLLLGLIINKIILLFKK